MPHLLSSPISPNLLIRFRWLWDLSVIDNWFLRSKHISQHQGNRYLPSPAPSQCQRRRHELAKADGAHATDQGIAPELLPSAEKMWLKLTKIVAFYGFLMVSVVSYPQKVFFSQHGLPWHLVQQACEQQWLHPIQQAVAVQQSRLGNLGKGLCRVRKCR